MPGLNDPTEEVCPMCGQDSEYLYEIEPELQPVCAGCAADYDLDKPVTEAEQPLIEPGASNHPPDCECETCESTQVAEARFGKFMQRISLEENRRGMKVIGDSPHRLRALREQERPMGLTRIGGR